MAPGGEGCRHTASVWPLAGVGRKEACRWRQTQELPSGLRVLRFVRLTVRRDRGGGGWAIHGAGAGSVAPHRQGPVRQGAGGAGACLSPGAAAIPHATNAVQGRPRSGVAANLVGRGARFGGCRTAALGRRAWPGERGVHDGVSVYVGFFFDGVGGAVDERLRQPQPERVDGAVRWGGIGYVYTLAPACPACICPTSSTPLHFVPSYPSSLTGARRVDHRGAEAGAWLTSSTATSGWRAGPTCGCRCAPRTPLARPWRGDDRAHG